MKGVTGDIHSKLGVRAGSTGWISLEDVEVPVEDRLGEEGEGFKIALSCLNNGRYTVAAGATGLLRACLEASVKYAHERRAFGKKISQHQLVHLDQACALVTELRPAIARFDWTAIGASYDAYDETMTASVPIR